MNGPQHYREAEQLLDQAAGTDDPARAQYRTARAQVHATLAVAAALAGMHVVQAGDEPAHVQSWERVIR